MSQVKMLLKETKSNLEELCEMVEEMDATSYGERGMYGNRDPYGERDMDYGERDAWRIERERRGRRR